MKLPVSQPGDSYEQEADQVAEQVMRMTAPTLQRACAGCGNGPESPDGENETPLQRKTERASDSSDSIPDNFLDNLGSGQPLDLATRGFVEPRFGHDFSGVRVHTDSVAADSAKQIGALAYTAGKDIVFAAGQYRPETTAGRSLIAHELTHVLQQSRPGFYEKAGTIDPSEPGSARNVSRLDPGAAGRHIQRAVDPDVSGPCGQTHTDVIDAAFKEARRLRSGAAAFLEAHVEHIQARAARAKDGYVKLGQTVLDELTLLERHFKISTVLRIALPYAAEDLVSVVDLQRFADASYWLRRRFSDVKLSDPYLCQVNCPKGRTSPHRIADAVAGGRKITFYTNCFDPLQPHTKAGIALHEAFHASFSEFDHDTYQTEKGYPGPDGLTNADSYAVFASIVTTGADFRVLDLGTVRGTDK